MNDRQLVLDAVQKMPENASLLAILDELNLLATVGEALAESEAGEGIPHNEVAKMLDQWIIK